MPAKKKASKKTSKARTTTRKRVSKKMGKASETNNQFFGALLIAVGVGALIVFLRYLIITWVMPADVYLVEPAQLIPGEVVNQ